MILAGCWSWCWAWRPRAKSLEAVAAPLSVEAALPGLGLPAPAVAPAPSAQMAVGGSVPPPTRLPSLRGRGAAADQPAGQSEAAHQEPRRQRARHPGDAGACCTSRMVATGRSADIERYRQNLKGEVDGAALYRLLADAEATPELAEVYRRLAGVEDRHAELWQSRLREFGVAAPILRPTFRCDSSAGWHGGSGTPRSCRW
jgi:hypothetical protein